MKIKKFNKEVKNIKKNRSTNWSTKDKKLHKMNRKKKILNEESQKTSQKTSSTLIPILWGSKKEREKGAGNIFKDIIDKNFPHLGKETDIQVLARGPKRSVQEDHTEIHYN